MLTKSKIGESEAIALVTTIITTKIFLAYPSIIASYGGSAGWMIVIISGLLALAFMWFIIKFVQRFPENTFPENVEKITGPYFGSLITLMVLVPWLLDVAMTFRRFSEMIVIIALPETSISIIMITFVAAASIAAYLGIKTIANACYLYFPFALTAILSIIVLTYHSWNIDWLFPLFGKGIEEVLKGGIIRSSDFSELNYIYILPLLFYSKQLKSIGYKSIIISIFVFLTIILTYTMTFSATVGEEPYLPLYTMARSVYLGRFLQRIEAIFVFFWVLSGYLWVSAGVYGFCRILTGLLKLPDYRPLILPSAVIIFALAFIPVSLPDAVLITNYAYRKFRFIPTFGLPILLLIIAIIRGKGVKAGVKR